MSTLTRSSSFSRLSEAFEARKWNKGQVKFSTTSKTDPHIKKIIAETAHLTNMSAAQVEQNMDDKIKEFESVAEKAPLLYNTIVKNIVEDTAFTLVQEHGIKSEGASHFSKMKFFELVYAIKSDHSQFYPLRSFLSHKRLYDAIIIFSDNPKYPEYKDVTTAAASPKGHFIFNPGFMQSLIDFAHLKQVKPKGKKYESNGGKIPDDYCYIEFVIIHEFMHYTYDDFHYQKIIPNANPTIINWVGDFRTNYLLVKSGYEQLPIGLFYDEINYDRQGSYKEMYDLVKGEFDKLNKDEQDKVKKKMNESSDDHEPGTDQGKSMEEGGDGEATMDDIDAQNEKISNKMKNSDDKSQEQTKAEQEAKSKMPDKGGQDAGKKDTNPHEIDYSKVSPQFTWTELIKKFISSADDSTEDTYSVPNRRNVSGVHIAAQVGRGALKPGEVPLDLKKAKIGFCIDCSGSMGGIIATVYANIINLLKTRANLSKNEITLIKFSNGFDIFKGVFAANKAAKVDKVTDRPKNWNLSLETVFKQFFGNATNFDTALANDIKLLLDDKYNILIFSDSDVVRDKKNFENLMSLIKNKNGKVFIVFDSHDTYIDFRKAAQFTTAYITYFK